MSSRPPYTEPLQLGGRELLLSPLSFGALEERSDDIRRMSLGAFETNDDARDSMLRLILAALQPRHPEVTQAELVAHLGWRQTQETALTVLKLSFPDVPGGATAGSPSGSSTGPS